MKSHNYTNTYQDITYREEDLIISVHKKNEIPDHFREQLPPMMQDMHWIGVILPPPDLERFAEELRVKPREHLDELWIIASLENTLVGYCRAIWMTKYDNLNRVELYEIYVIEKLRRKGIGKKLIKTLLTSIPDHITIFGYWAIEKTAGEAFMENVFQKKPGYTIRQSVSKIRKFQLEDVSVTSNELKSQAMANGYEIIYIGNAEFAKYVNVQEYVTAVESIEHDMPLEELSLERPNLTKERFLQNYERGKKRGYSYMTFVALNDGKIVGMTEIMIDAYQPHVAWQAITGIISSHRGNQLGLTLKYQMLTKLLRDTKVKYWFTDNAGSNEHMININDKLGFKEWPKGYLYETNINEINL
ncbi:MAG: GNAT family N-acetyltransferase [Candidatus Kariarchaeaceae archaeon]|jgi:GNAT superfamily N-acetyltransferase